ncbi:MAG: hypothetical protein GEU86_22480 [Actinophytocola sp.]|nr:hypothetical protein [Actinophytocola sp.]
MGVTAKIRVRSTRRTETRVMQEVSTNTPDQPHETAVLTAGANNDVELPARDRPQPLPRLALRLLPELAVLVLCAVLYTQTADYDAGSTGGPGPALYPRILIGLLAFAAVFLVAQQIRQLLRQRRGAPAEPQPDDLAEENLSSPRVALIIGMAIGYVIATMYLGWFIATICFVTAFLFLAGKRKLWFTVPLATALAIGFCYVFVKVVYIALPTGVGIFDEITFRLLQLIGAY